MSVIDLIFNRFKLTDEIKKTTNKEELFDLLIDSGFTSKEMTKKHGVKYYTFTKNKSRMLVQVIIGIYVCVVINGSLEHVIGGAGNGNT